MRIAAVPITDAEPRGSVVAPGYGRRDYLLRRMLAGGDAVALLVALIATIATSHHTHGTFGSRLLLGLATIPVWIALFKVYGLYDRDVRRVSHSTIDEVPWLFHALLTGSL